jgi:tight adherence protein B
VLDACAAAAKDDAEAELAREAALAGPQLSARVLAWLPAVGLGFGMLVDPGMVRVFATPVGAGLLAIGAALAAGGRWWMRRLVLRASPAAHPLGVALHAVRAAMGAGADVASAIAAVGNAMAPEPTLASAAARMSTAATALARGEEWAAVWSGAELDPLERALRLPWERGAQAAPLLTAVATGEALRRRRAAQVAAAELGVRLTLPLALCLLPAFVVVGIAPLVLSVVRAVF